MTTKDAHDAEGWMPIASAPRDGTPVLLWLQKWAGEIGGINAAQTIEIGTFSDGLSDYPGNEWWDLGGDYYSTWGWPSHWMPLPPAPTTSGEEG